MSTHNIRNVVVRAVVVDADTRQPFDEQPTGVNMLDVSPTLTLLRLYSFAADLVGNANTVGCTPVCDEPAVDVVTQRIFDWGQLYRSLMRIEQGVREGGVVNVEDIISLAYAPVICKYEVAMNAIILMFGVYKPPTSQRGHVRQQLLDVNIVEPTGRERQRKEQRYQKKRHQESHWKTVMVWAPLLKCQDYAFFWMPYTYPAGWSPTRYFEFQPPIQLPNGRYMLTLNSFKPGVLDDLTYSWVPMPSSANEQRRFLSEVCAADMYYNNIFNKV